MDFKDEFRATPLPVEKEFSLLSIKSRLQELSRKELEEFLVESLTIMTKLAHQVSEMVDYIHYVQGKSKQL
jgi:uncharacterized coiled-coil protein SlyX